MIQYEDKIEEIDELLARSRSQWMLDSITWMDYDDVSQQIRFHIHEKWDKWDQSRPFKPWCRTLIVNQIKNKVRNHYTNFCRPCLKDCPYNQGGDLCGLTTSGIQDSECKDFAKWQKKKEIQYNMKLPYSLENKPVTNSVELHDEFDFDESAANLHAAILERLTNERHIEIYRLLYLEERDDEYVANKMGFTPEQGRRGVRWKQLNNVKKRFLEIAKEVLDSEDIIG